MVLDLLFSPEDIELHPVEMFVYSSLVGILSGLFALMIFNEYASIVFPFLITIALLSPVHKLLEDQERVEERLISMSLFRRYKRILEIYLFMFFGVLFSTVLLIAFVPYNHTNVLFKEQIDTLNAIRGEEINIQGNYYNFQEEFFDIFFNNLKVLFIAFILSFFFGSGALFIISWNASVVGVFVSLYGKVISQSTGTPLLLSHLQALLSISLHGIPEVIGYFLGGVAGGVLSFGLIEGESRKLILIDSLKVFFIGSIFILVAAFIESILLPLL